MHRYLSVVLLASIAAAQSPQFLPDQNRTCWQLPSAEATQPYRQLLLGDLDGDGDGDAVSESLAGVFVHLQGAAPIWGRTLVGWGAGSSATAVLLADLNGDGHLDVLTGMHTPASLFSLARLDVQLLSNDGSGGFSSNLPGVNLGLDLVPQRIVAGDVDGDGDQDVVLAGSPGSNPPGTFLHLLRNDGSGALQRIVGALPVAAAGCWPLLADFDGDGDRDLLVAQPFGPTLFLRNQGGVFTAQPGFVPAAAAGYRELVALDCDGDADLDVLATKVAGSVDLLRNTGAALTRTADAVAGVVLQLGVGDLDGDGDVDAVARTTQAIVAHQNDGGGTFTAMPVISRAVATRCLAVGVIDAGGFADALVGWDDPVLSGLAYMGSPTGLQADPMIARVAPPIGVGPHAAPLAGVDLNGDGRQDHLNLVDELNGSSWVRQLTAGRFGALAASREGIAFNVPNTAAAVDLDGDSDLDIIAHTYLNHILWLPNNGGQFGAPIYMNGLDASAAAWGDVDGDSDVDVIEVDTFGPAVLRLNAGNGVFAAGVALPESGWFYSRAALLADLDGDGDLDAITGRGSPGCLDVLRNTGAAGFVLQPGCAYPTSSMPSGMRSADLDGDGDLDVVQWNGAETRLMFNSGAATFTDQTVLRLLPAPASNVSDVVAFDADVDGDQDLLLLRHGQLQLLYQNDGSGVFTDVSFQRWSQVQGGERGAVADLDADGDPDVVVDQQIAWNHLRQLSSLQEPRLGGALVLRLHLEPGQLVTGFGLVAIAFQPLPTAFQVPGITGTIELAAAGHLPLVTMPPTTGVFTQSLPIPVGASLLGTDLYAQSLYLSSRTGIAVSNALHERIR